MSATLDNLYENIRSILLEARKRTYKAVNFVMVETYWNIGKMIVEEEQKGKVRADYGKQLLLFLSKRLTTEFGEGFNLTNLKYMRLFYQAFPIRHALRDELTWTHYRLLSKIENENARLFYISESIEAQWSTRQMERQIRTFYYERLLKSQDRKGMLVETNAKAEILQPSRQLFASKYKLYLPTEEELALELKREIADLKIEKKLLELDNEKTEELL